MRRLRAALAALAVACLAGCYDIGTPVITLEDARALPWLIGEWNFPSGRQVIVFAGNHPNEYRYRDISGQNVATGTLRAVPLGAELYLVQATDDNDDVAALFFRRHTDGSVKELTPNDKVIALAKRFGVTIDDLEEFTIVDGTPAQIRAFLLAHTPAHF